MRGGGRRFCAEFLKSRSRCSFVRVSAPKPLTLNKHCADRDLIHLLESSTSRLSGKSVAVNCRKRERERERERGRERERERARGREREGESQRTKDSGP